MHNGMGNHHTKKSMYDNTFKEIKIFSLVVKCPSQGINDD